MKPKEWRIKEGYTLDQLAEKLGYSKGYLSEVERGLKSGSIPLAAAYKRASNGKVTANDFYAEAQQ